MGLCDIAESDSQKIYVAIDHGARYVIRREFRIAKLQHQIRIKTSSCLFHHRLFFYSAPNGLRSVSFQLNREPETESIEQLHDSLKSGLSIFCFRENLVETFLT